MGRPNSDVRVALDRIISGGYLKIRKEIIWVGNTGRWEQLRAARKEGFNS